MSYTPSFEEATESRSFTEELQVEAGDDESSFVSLKFVKYQYCHSITLFIVDNQGGKDTTRVDFIQVQGLLIEKTKDLSNLMEDKTQG